MHSDIYLLGTEVLLTDHCYFEVSCTLEYRAAPNPSKSLPPSLVAIPTLHQVLNPVSHQPAEATVILYNFQLRLPTLKFGSWSLCSRSTNVDSVVVPPPVWVWDIPNPKLWFMKLLWQMHKCWLCAHVISSIDMKNSNPAWSIMKQLPAQMYKCWLHDCISGRASTSTHSNSMSASKNSHTWWIAQNKDDPSKEFASTSTAIIHGMLLHPWGNWIVTKPGYGQSYWWPNIKYVKRLRNSKNFWKNSFACKVGLYPWTSH